MIPAPLKPFLPMLVAQLRQRLATEPPGALASELTIDVRAQLTPAEQGRLAQVLQLTAGQLGV